MLKVLFKIFNFIRLLIEILVDFIFNGEFFINVFDIFILLFFGFKIVLYLMVGCILWFFKCFKRIVLFGDNCLIILINEWWVNEFFLLFIDDVISFVNILFKVFLLM